MRLLMLGIDGLDYRAYRTFGQQYCWPLRSPVPTTGPAWTSIYTGQPATAHGVFLPWGQATADSRPARELADECAWMMLPSEVKVGLFSMPMAFPPATRQLSFYVPGFPAAARYEPELQQLSNPPQPPEFWIERDVTEEDLVEGSWWADKNVFSAYDSLRVSRRHMAELFADYVEQYDVDFGAVGFRWIDRMCHIYGARPYEWFEADKMGVELVDELLTYLLERLQPEAWIVASDHGTFRTEHTMLGTLVLGGVLAERLKERRWWNVRDVAGFITGAFNVPAPEPWSSERISRPFWALTGNAAAADRVATMGAIRLNLGCGKAQIRDPEWLNVDVVPYPGVDMIHNLTNGLPFPDETITEIRAYDVLEHLSYVINSTVLGEWCRVLKPGGVLTLRSPDLGRSAKGYAQGQLSFLGLLQKAYGRACSLDLDTHFSGIDWDWLVGQLTYWGCSEIYPLPDPAGDPYAIVVRAVKGVTPEPKDASGSWEGSGEVHERLEDLGYLPCSTQKQLRT